MTRILIIKLGATGDVVRTTPILGQLDGRVMWLTAAKNTVLLEGIASNIHCLSWEQRHLVPELKYDLVINLEDTIDVARFVMGLKFEQLFGAYADGRNQMLYTRDSQLWFDLSLISRFGLSEADKLKLQNRRCYQEIIFEGLGWRFNGEKYRLPEPIETGLCGDVAISAQSGPVWPMKNWAYYAELKCELESRGLTVNVLGKRESLLEHLADVRNHRCLVGGDSLPMHFALGTGTRCVSIFTCTSPWEIYDYGIQKKIVSPSLAEFFYQRGYDRRATMAIGVEQVLSAIVGQLEIAKP